jgi:hypothetical protein
MGYLTQLSVTSSYAAVILLAVIVTGLGFGIIFAVTINTATATAGVRGQDAGVASALVKHDAAGWRRPSAEPTPKT